jgi:hypothetical protein
MAAMTRFRLATLVAAVLFLGACGSHPKSASRVATLDSGQPAAAGTANTAPAVGVQLRLDMTDEEKIKIIENYQECLFNNGVKEVPRDGSAAVPAGKQKRQLDQSGEPKSAYTACGNKKPLDPVETDPNRNPNFTAQWEANIRCLRTHGLRVHSTKPGGWTYDDDYTQTPDNLAQIERDCMLETFSGKKK